MNQNAQISETTLLLGEMVCKFNKPLDLGIHVYKILIFKHRFSFFIKLARKIQTPIANDIEVINFKFHV